MKDPEREHAEALHAWHLCASCPSHVLDLHYLITVAILPSQKAIGDHAAPVTSACVSVSSNGPVDPCSCCQCMTQYQMHCDAKCMVMIEHTGVKCPLHHRRLCTLLELVAAVDCGNAVFVVS